ncbi:MAG: hypothetical protein HRU15_15180 [Planctomycetes bacterium]|nr:hypothetical protein [Planctomycetota bacterium]
MVNIGPQFGNIDPLGDRRRLEKVQNDKEVIRNEQKQGPDHSDSLSSNTSISQEEIERYVSILKNMDPADLHRVEDLRQSIEDGSYDSSLNELIDPLLDFLSDGNTPA